MFCNGESATTSKEQNKAIKALKDMYVSEETVGTSLFLTNIETSLFLWREGPDMLNFIVGICGTKSELLLIDFQRKNWMIY